MSDTPGHLPKKPLSPEEIIDTLKSYSASDDEPGRGGLFAYVYETGLEDLKDIAHKAYNLYAEKNALDFTVFPSVLKMERDIFNIVSELLHGGEGVTGVFTSGGTESNFLAVYAARNYFRKKKGLDVVPEIVMPMTAHPSFDKAGDYLGMRVKRIPIDPDTLKLNLNLLDEYITDETAIVIASAPDWPFGNIDPVKEIAEITSEKGVWLHVDACLGGFILPFLKKLGINIPDFDLSIDGVYSISADIHKYGYAPKGASTLLFRDGELKLYSIYASVKWPGYIFINPTMLSSRSLGPVAAAWAAIHYLGEEGYISLTRKILNAKNKIMNGFEELGFKLLGDCLTTVLAYTHPSINIFNLVDVMMKRGWHLQAQPGVPELDIPPNIHLTLMPIHETISDEFVKDLKTAVEEAREMPRPNIEPILTLLENIEFENIGDILNLVGVGGGEPPKETALINELIRVMPPELAEYILKYFVVYMK